MAVASAFEFINVQTLTVTGGAFTITAANGDTIQGTYEGAAAPTAVEGVITYLVSGPITGGTGRFAGAAGMLTFSGIADLRTSVLSETISGQISNVGGWK